MARKSLLRKIVQAEFDCTPRSFWRAASQRLEAAGLLLESESTLDAVYLAGYTVECGLKALILERTPPAQRQRLCQEMTSGARAHNFDVLSGLLKVRGCAIPRMVGQYLESLGDEWSTDLRYMGAFIPRREAERFIDRVRFVYAWLVRST